jgi:hypothetical protein
MSSILKALNKLEQDKNPQKKYTLPAHASVLKSRPSRQLTGAGVSLAALFLFICGSAAMYAFMKRPVTNVTVTQPKVADTQVTPTPVIVVQPTLSKTPTSAPVRAAVPIPPLTRLDLAPQTKTENAPQKVSQKDEKRIEHPTSAPTETPKTQQAKSVKPAPALKVHGIAFQEGAAESVAVVNGISVSKGTVIDGVTVDEILKDKVRFKIGQETIEVELGKSSR